MDVSSSLVNLALLESLKGNKVVDEVDLFVPYLALAICSLEEESFDIPEVKRSFNDQFSISPPEAALKVILTRAKKNGLVRLSNHQYFKVPEALNPILEGSRGKKKDVELSLSLLIKDFILYSKDQHDKELSEVEASSFLYGYIKNHVSEFVGALSGDFNGIDTKIKNREYLTACFIKSLYEEKKELLKDLERIIKGVLLANYITYADKITTKESFNNITIYLDSPIILGLLGFSGPIRKRSLSEFLGLIRDLDITVCVFESTVAEVERLFGAWKDGLEKRKYDKFKPKTLELLNSKGLDANGLETEIALVESKICNLGIKIEKYFKIDKRYQCDETELEDFLKLKGFRNDLRHDVTSMSKIFNSREGKEITSFDNEFSIFATLSSGLESAINQFFEDQIGKNSIPLIASERWLATMLWLKKPNVFSDLPLNLLLSNAYSTIYSDDKFWNSFLTRLSDLKKRGDISENDFKLVRWDRSLIEKVHDTSLETGEDFENEDIFDIVENIKKEHFQEKDNELSALKQENQESLEALNKEKQRVEIENSRTGDKITNLCHGVATISSGIIAAILIAGVAFALITTAPNNPFVESDSLNFKSWYATSAIIILIILTFGNLIFGSTIRGAYHWVHKRINDSILSYFKSPNDISSNDRKEPAID